MKNKWITWYKQLSSAEAAKIADTILVNIQKSIQNLQLHCFNDASSTSLSICCLSKISYQRTNIYYCHFPSQITPINKLSLLRLELMSATLGTGLTAYNN